MEFITSLENCKIWILFQVWKKMKLTLPSYILTYHKGDVGVEDLNEGVIEAEDDINP